MSPAAVLALDAGNTRVKWGLRVGDDWAARGAVATAEAERLGRDWPGLPPGTVGSGSNVGGPARGRRGGPEPYCPSYST